MNLQKTLISLIIIGIAIVLPHSGIIPVPFVYSIPILLIIWLYLRCVGEDFANLGFRLKSFRVKSALIGILFAIAFVTFSQLLLFPLLEHFMEFEEVEVELYNKLKGNTSFYLFILLMNWMIGALYEEIVFHGFVFTRIEKMIPGKFATLTGFLLTSILFGLYHLQLGAADAINAFLIGAGYLGLILYYKRDMWVGIFCHGTYNSIAITLLYLDYL